MLSKSKFFTKFTTELPDNNQLSPIYFVPMSLECLEEMHSYSIKEKFYDYFEFAPFKNNLIKRKKS